MIKTVRKILSILLSKNIFSIIERFYFYLKKYSTYYSNIPKINTYIIGKWKILFFPFFGSGVFFNKEGSAVINLPRKYWDTLPMIADIISYGGYPSWEDGKIKIEKENIFLVSSPKDKSVAVAIKEMFIDDEYDLKTKDLKGKVILDIGANIGDTAIMFSKYGAKKVFCFEPLPMLKEYLLENININGFNHIIEPHFVGLSDKEEKIDIWAMEFGSAGASAELHRPEIREYKPGYIKQKLNIENAMDYFNKHNICNIDIIKMDCEMCEYALLKNDLLLRQLDPELVMIEYHDGYDKLITVLQNLNFNIDLRKKRPNVGLIFASKK